MDKKISSTPGDTFHLMPKSKASEDKFMHATMMQQSTFSEEIKGFKS
jgi:hypothetical protein